MNPAFRSFLFEIILFPCRELWTKHEMKKRSCRFDNLFYFLRKVTILESHDHNLDIFHIQRQTGRAMENSSFLDFIRRKKN